MADEIENEETETETPVVEVTVEEAEENPAPEEETVVDAGDTTVIVDTPETPGVSEEEVDRWVQLEAWKTQVEGTLLGLVTAQATVEAEAEAAIEEAQEATQEAQDAFAEAEAAEAEATDDSEETADEAPSSARTHWLFESRGDRRSRKEAR